MPEQTLKHILDLFNNSDVFFVGNSPTLSNVCVAGDITGVEDNQVVRASWVDAAGLSHAVIFTEGGLAAGRWENNSFIAEDHEGTEIKVGFHKLHLNSPEDETEKTKTALVAVFADDGCIRTIAGRNLRGCRLQPSN